MARSNLLEVLRRAIPIRYRRRIPKPVRRMVAQVFWINAAIYASLALLAEFLLAPYLVTKNRTRELASLHDRLLALANLMRAKRALFEGDYVSARNYLDTSLKTMPNVDYAHYLRGHIAVILNDNKAAIDDLNRAINLGFDSGDAHFYLALAYSNMGQTEHAIRNYELAITKTPHWAQGKINLAHLKLWVGEEDAAVKLLHEAITIDPAYSMSHQNVAALYDRAAYKPVPLDLECRREIMLYDAYNFAAERTFNAGIGSQGVGLWGNALRIQGRIASDFELPQVLLEQVRAAAPIDRKLPIRLLPYEWVTQLGHIAMLDTYCKIQGLGWRPAANLLLLAPNNKVVNQAYLQQWQQHLHIITDNALVNALFPYQRYIGDCFNAYLHEDGQVEAWPDVGARAHIEWDRQGRQPLLSISETDSKRGRKALAELGMPEDAWFVSLHAREGGFHREESRSSQEHRNTSITDYFAAIRCITDRGGWVVRVGDPSMTPLPPMPQVIDYAHSTVKSDWMDVFLCGSPRYFIGTTSGLTNVVISFGTPCLLVNCLSNFSQLWNNKVLFTLKLFWSETENRYLKLEEIVRDPVRSKVFNINALIESGITPLNNSSEDILQGVQEMFTRLEGRTLRPPAGEPVMQQWQQVMADNIMFGNGQPCLSFLERHRRELFNRDAATSQNTEH